MSKLVTNQVAIGRKNSRVALSCRDEGRRLINETSCPVEKFAFTALRVNRVTVLAIKTIKLLESIGTGHRSNLPMPRLFFVLLFLLPLLPSPLLIFLSIRAASSRR